MKNVILFGAGAVLDWGAPSNSDLTKLILSSGFFCNDNKTRINQYIYKTLLQNSYKEQDINFETIINVIEELIVYYSLFDNRKNYPSILKSLFTSIHEESLLNFSIVGGEFKHGSRLEIPKGKEYIFNSSTGAIKGETAEQYFFSLQLAETITDISSQIINYSYHSEGDSQIFSKENSHINKLFKNWIKNLNPDVNVIRMYTLNYDRIFKFLAQYSGINDVFEGFQNVETDDWIPKAIDIPRIVNDFNNHCHYNLHGSVYWDYNIRDRNQLYNPKIVLSGAPSLQLNLIEQPTIQVNKGQYILLSNLITGYQKTQKGFIPPFRQMNGAFDKDCLIADNLFIIGYSFGDEHINMSIKSALEYNPKLRTYIVDPAYDETNGKKGYELLIDRFIAVFLHYLQNRGSLNKINDKICQYFDKKITVYTMGMKQFMKEFEYINLPENANN